MGFWYIWMQAIESRYNTTILHCIYPATIVFYCLTLYRRINTIVFYALKNNVGKKATKLL